MRCVNCGHDLNGVEHAPDTCIDNLQRQIEKLETDLDEQDQDNVNLRQQLAAREAELINLRSNINDLVKEMSFDAMSERDEALRELADRDARIATIKNDVLACVAKVKYGLGAGGHSTGMYVEVELGSAICDAITDAIEDAISGKESGK